MAVNGILLNNNTSSNLQITDIVSIRSEPIGETSISNFIPKGNYYFAIDSIILSYNSSNGTLYRKDINKNDIEKSILTTFTGAPTDGIAIYYFNEYYIIPTSSSTLSSWTTTFVYKYSKDGKTWTTNTVSDTTDVRRNGGIKGITYFDHNVYMMYSCSYDESNPILKIDFSSSVTNPKVTGRTAGAHDMEKMSGNFIATDTTNSSNTWTKVMCLSGGTYSFHYSDNIYPGGGDTYLQNIFGISEHQCIVWLKEQGFYLLDDEKQSATLIWHTGSATAKYFSPFGVSIYNRGFLYKGFHEADSISASSTSQVMTSPFVNTPISYYQGIPIAYILIVDYTTAYLAKQTNRGILKQGDVSFGYIPANATFNYKYEGIPSW